MNITEQIKSNQNKSNQNKTKQYNTKRMTTFITKYKPYHVREFFFDEKLENLINTFLKIDHLNLLFIGNPSSGKTTLLYALIRDYYGLSAQASLPENNLLFINNLKEQGIQYFRNELKTFCQSHSAIHGKKKIVIIDDIDTINEQGQQVFRNYIDKYSHNVHFISVCTSIQKVIESIQSRVHIIQLTVPSKENIEQTMNRIIAAENLVIDEESKEYLIKMSGSSTRVLINYMEKMFILGEPITIDLCKQLCSNISFQRFEEYFTLLKDRNLMAAIQVLLDINDYGYSVIDIFDYFFTFIKIADNIIDEETKYRIIPFLCKYITVFHNIHEDGIELAFFTNHIYDLLYPATI